MTAEADQLERLLMELRTTIVGQNRLLERVVVSLLAGGHCLIEGVPGLAKTLAIETLARATGGTFSRIQLTPDLIPADIVGTCIYRASSEEFDVEPGPVFANIVLADEINRAPAKVQSALLEVMAERQVSIGGTTFPAPDPFLVLATQNPIESEGVYQLPEAQRDRFLMRVVVDYPSAEEEAEIVRRMGVEPPVAREVISAEDVRGLQSRAKQVYVDREVLDYAVRLVMATRDPAAHGLSHLAGQLAYGARPRASLGLVAGGRAIALLRARDYVLPQDIYDVGFEVLNHRLVLSYETMVDGRSAEQIAVNILRHVEAPRVAPTQLDGRQAATARA